MKYESVLALVGKTPHVRVHCADAPDARIYAKLEGQNPTGSVKDRAAIAMIRAAQDRGDLTSEHVLLDASSGNFACAVAYYGRLIGLPVMLVVSSKVTEAKRAFLRYYGARVQQVGDFTIEGNRYCRTLLGVDDPRYFFLDQLHNPDNPLAHYRTTGPEILAAHPHLGMLVGSLGSGGTLSGAGRFLKERRPDVRIVAVQASAGTRLPGTGSFDDGDYVTPFIRAGFDEHIFDETIRIDEVQAIRRTHELRDQGIFGGLQTGGVLQAAVDAVGRHDIGGDIVMLSGDAGWKSLDRLMVT